MSALRGWWSGKQKCPHNAVLAKDCLRCLKRLLEKHGQELLFDRDVEWTLAVLGDTATCHEPQGAAELLDADSDALHRIIECLKKKIAKLEKQP